MLNTASDYFENWNRYYDPMSGRYLASEPQTQDPKFVLAMAKQSTLALPFAYALNNPVTRADAEGSWPWEWRKAKRIGYWGYSGSARGGGSCTCFLRIDTKAEGWFNDQCWSVTRTLAGDNADDPDHKHPDCAFNPDNHKDCQTYCSGQASAAWSSASARSSWGSASCIGSGANIFLDVEY